MSDVTQGRDLRQFNWNQLTTAEQEQIRRRVDAQRRLADQRADELPRLADRMQREIASTRIAQIDGLQLQTEKHLEQRRIAEEALTELDKIAELDAALTRMEIVL